MPTSPPQLPESSRFEDFSPREVARQLSLYILSLVRAVNPVEFFNFTWFKAPKTVRSLFLTFSCRPWYLLCITKVPHMKDLLLFCVDLSDWVATRVLELKEPRERMNVPAVSFKFPSLRILRCVIDDPQVLGNC